MKILLLLLAIFCNVWSVRAQNGQQSNSPSPVSSEPQAPRVSIQRQPDSPLRITSVKTQWVMPDRNGIEIYVEVKNVGDKAINAYVTRLR